eukprot:1763866-Rhodomonas_salina.1
MPVPDTAYASTGAAVFLVNLQHVHEQPGKRRQQAQYKRGPDPIRTRAADLVPAGAQTRARFAPSPARHACSYGHVQYAPMARHACSYGHVTEGKVSGGRT